MSNRLNIVRENRFEVIENGTDKLVAVYYSWKELLVDYPNGVHEFTDN